MSYENNKKAPSRIVLWTSVLVVLAVISGGVAYVAMKQPKSDPVPTIVLGDEQSILKPRPNDWIRGQISAPVTLIEYADFQCPACASYYPLIKKAEQSYPTQLRVIYRNWPLVVPHKHAMDAARAAEAAGNQGKFWEMHDVLFEHQKDWSDVSDVAEIYKGYAKQIGLDGDRFMKDWRSDAVHARILASTAEAEKLQLQGTPSFFLNGKRIENPSSLDDLRYLIENAQK